MDRRSLISMLTETVVFLAIIIFGWNYYNGKLDQSEQNLKVYRGQISELELKNGDLITSRDSYIAKNADLEELLEISRSELKELKNTLGSKVAYIAKLESQISTGPIIIEKDSIIYVENSHIESHFNFNNEWMSLEGVTKIQDGLGSTRFNHIKMYTPLKVGLTNDYQIFVQTSNPYVIFSNIEGAVIDGSALAPKKKKLSWGVQFGFGTMYDIIDKKLSLGPYGGVGIEINF